MHSSHDYDIAIIGGGPVGCVLALLLAKQARYRIALLRKPTALLDPRVMALNYGSQVLLESLNAWPDQGASIHTVHVSQAGRLGRTKIDRQDYQVPQLGCVVSYQDLMQTLNATIAQSNVSVLEGGLAQAQQNGNQGVVITQDDLHVHAQIAVLAEGKPQHLGLNHQYQQTAILGTVQAQHPKTHWAWERFTQQGPLALLPHPIDNNYSMVWCVEPQFAQMLIQAPDNIFNQHLNSTFGTRLGKLNTIGPKHAMPLSLQMQDPLVDGAIVSIGNAAQTLHPVSGQGLNLGLRDAAQLSFALTQSDPKSTKITKTQLDLYIKSRFFDRNTTVKITHNLSHFFTKNVTFIEHLCGLGLLSLDIIPRLRMPLAHHLLQGGRFVTT